MDLKLKDPIMRNLTKLANLHGVFFKRSDTLDGSLRGGIYGAALGGLGTAGYDFINKTKGTPKELLLRALSGAGVGGIGGAGLGALGVDFMKKKKTDPRRRSAFIPEETPSSVLSPSSEESPLSPSREESPLSIGRERDDRPSRPSFLPEGTPRSPLSIGREREDRPSRPSFLPEGNPRSVLGQ